MAIPNNLKELAKKTMKTADIGKFERMIVSIAQIPGSFYEQFLDENNRFRHIQAAKRLVVHWVIIRYLIFLEKRFDFDTSFNDLFIEFSDNLHKKRFYELADFPIKDVANTSFYKVIEELKRKGQITNMNFLGLLGYLHVEEKVIKITNLVNAILREEIARYFSKQYNQLKNTRTPEEIKAYFEALQTDYIKNVRNALLNEVSLKLSSITDSNTYYKLLEDWLPAP